MKSYYPKIGAIFYALWGILHIVGAAVLLLQVTNASTTVVLATIGSATAETDLPQISNSLLDAVLGYYAWNLLWIGCLVMVVAVRFNWRNHLSGYWLNLVMVSAVDLGLVALLLAPGHMALADGMMGIALWLPAIFFSTLGLLSNRSSALRQAPAV